MTTEEHKKFLEQDFDDIKLEDMLDMKKCQIDSSLPLDKRRQQYLKKVSNPYLIRIGNVKVKIRFANNGISFEEAFKNMLLTM